MPLHSVIVLRPVLHLHSPTRVPQSIHSLSVRPLVSVLTSVHLLRIHVASTAYPPRIHVPPRLIHLPTAHFQFLFTAPTTRTERRPSRTYPRLSRLAASVVWFRCHHAALRCSRRISVAASPAPAPRSWHVCCCRSWAPTAHQTRCGQFGVTAGADAAGRHSHSRSPLLSTAPDPPAAPGTCTAPTVSGGSCSCWHCRGASLFSLSPFRPGRSCIAPD